MSGEEGENLGGVLLLDSIAAAARVALFSPRNPELELFGSRVS